MNHVEIIRLIRTKRFTLSTEEQLKIEMAEVFTKAGLEFEKEFRLNAKDRLDFYFPSTRIVMEVKIKGGAKDIFKQCERYCHDLAVSRLILVSNRTLGLPAEICGKPCNFVSLGASWL